MDRARRQHSYLDSGATAIYLLPAEAFWCPVGKALHLGGNMQILAVDDDLFSTRLLSALLRQMGHSVREARNGSEAWEAYEADPAPLVITDLMMPEMDGIALCNAIRGSRRLPYTYIIMCSAQVDGHGNAGIASAGADDYLAKPLDVELLTERIEVAERVLAAY